MKSIVIFASGQGSNAINLVRYFNAGNFAEVKAIFCNKKTAGVLSAAESLHIKTHVFDRQEFYESDEVINQVKALKPDVVVLAGFLWLVPQNFIQAFDGLILNLHPSLLPKYGGKGMYGRKVHEAVLENAEKQSGISIHLVNDEYDKGEIIDQFTFEIEMGENVESLEQKIHALEHQYLPLTVEKFLKRRESDAEFNSTGNTRLS